MKEADIPVLSLLFLNNTGTVSGVCMYSRHNGNTVVYTLSRHVGTSMTRKCACVYTCKSQQSESDQVPPAEAEAQEIGSDSGEKDGDSV